MSNNIESNDKPTIIGSFANVAGLIAASLYFVGWIYRWQYYGFFQLEITSLDFPFQSFLFVPLQVFFGNSQAILKVIFAIIIIAIVIDLVIWLVEILREILDNKIKQIDRQQSLVYSYKNKKQKPLITKIWLSRTRFNIIKFDYLKFLVSLLEEIIVILVVLAALYVLAKNQGFADARRDAINSSSTLPVITLIVDEKKTVLGRQLDDVFTNPSLKGYRIFGDKGLFDDVRTTELNNLYNRDQPIVWRLLIDQESWIYLIRTLPSNAEVNTRPPVLAIQKSFGDQLMILSPEAITPDTPQYITPKPIPVTPE